MTAQRVVCPAPAQEGFELLPDGLDDVWLDGGNGACSFRSGSLEDSPDDGVYVPALHVDALPVDASLANGEKDKRSARVCRWNV